MRNKIFIFLQFGLLTLTASATAQSTRDTTTWKAIYLNFGPNILSSGMSLGATLVAHENWYVASRLDWMNLDARQLPSDFKLSTTTDSYSSPSPQNNNSSGSCLFCIGPIVPNLSSGGSNSGSSNGSKPFVMEKQIRLITFSAGWMYQLPNPMFRLRAEAGLAMMKINEPVDFIFVPGSVEEISDNYSRITTEGYTFTAEERKLTGLLLRAGVEFPVTKIIGFNTSFTAAVANDERHFGWNIGLMLGLLR